MQQPTLEDRVEALELMQQANLNFCFLVLALIIRQNDKLKSDVSGAILHILQHPVAGSTDSEVLRNLLLGFRSGLIAPPDAEMTEIFSQPHIRPVEHE